VCVARAAYCRDALPEADGGAIIQLGGSGRLWRWFCVAWLWWSISVPCWLTRPDGHFFGNTEIKCRAMARRERELKRSE
jgi:hypothetical protein